MIRFTLDEQVQVPTAQTPPAADTDSWHTLDELAQAALLLVQRLRAQQHSRDTSAQATRPAQERENATRAADSEREEVPGDSSVREL